MRRRRGAGEGKTIVFWTFRSFIDDMEMGDIKFKGDLFTWANNREGKGFIQERLDRFVGSGEWMLNHDSAMVTHFRMQSSDHSLLVLDSEQKRAKTKTRFIFYLRLVQDQETEGLAREVWGRNVLGSRMFSPEKIKRLQTEIY